jgi:dTMP kinase
MVFMISPGGYIIVFEGIDGSGKTTIARRVVDLLGERGFRAIYTYEPFESPFSEALYRIKEEGYTSPIIDALAMVCDRAYHVETVVEPALRRGDMVVMDRYYYSTIAYQGAMGVDIEWLRIVNSIFRKPDLAIYLDIDPEEGLRRSGGHKKWRFYEVRDILRAARSIYLDLVRKGELIMIDARKPLDIVTREVWDIIERELL